LEKEVRIYLGKFAHRSRGMKISYWETRWWWWLFQCPDHVSEIELSQLALWNAI